MREPNYLDDEYDEYVEEMRQKHQRDEDIREAAIEEGQKKLPKISEGKGLSAITRPKKPDELNPDETHLEEICRKYWWAEQKTPDEFEGRSQILAAAWAERNTGSDEETYQSINWYARTILDIDEKIAEEIFREFKDDLDVQSSIVRAAAHGYHMGALHTEALWKQNHEPAAIAHNSLAEKKKKGSKRGGQGTKTAAERRKQIFNQIALDNVTDWIGLSPRQRIKILRKLTTEDRDHGDKFRKGSDKEYTDGWYADRLSDLQASGQPQKAIEQLKKAKKKP